MVLVCVLVLVVASGVGWFSFRGDDDVPLGDGFTVAEGTELLGTVFPDRRNGWIAHLELIGNPVVVMNRYLDQARDAGFSTAVKCSIFYDVPPSPVNRYVLSGEASFDDEVPEGGIPRRFMCEATGERTSFISGAKGSHRSQSFRMTVMRSMPGNESLNTATLRAASVEPVGEREYDDGVPAALPEGWRRAVPQSWVARAPSRPRVKSAPLPGQRFVRSYFPYKVIRVEKGTEIVTGEVEGADMGEVTCYGFVGRVVGDRDTVLDSYFKQIATMVFPHAFDPETNALRRWFKPPAATESSFRGERLTQISARDFENGTNQTVITAVGATHPWLHVSICVR